MDDLLREFVTETHESLDVVDVELVRFEQDPNNAEILGNVFRLVHTIKGTCGFLGLPRLEALAHAAEALMGKFRDGAPATRDAVTVILATIDRIKTILDSLEREQREPEGSDEDLIGELARMAECLEPPPAAEPERAVGTLAPQVLGTAVAAGRGLARRSRTRLSRHRSRGDPRQAGRRPPPARTRSPPRPAPSRSASPSTRSSI